MTASLAWHKGNTCDTPPPPKEQRSHGSIQNPVISDSQEVLILFSLPLSLSGAAKSLKIELGMKYSGVTCWLLLEFIGIIFFF